MKSFLNFLLCACITCCTVTSCDLMDGSSNSDKPETEQNGNDDRHEHDDDYMTCAFCKGDGLCMTCNGDGTFGGKRCRKCAGTGICSRCDGSGVVEI